MAAVMPHLNPAASSASGAGAGGQAAVSAGGGRSSSSSSSGVTVMTTQNPQLTLSMEKLLEQAQASGELRLGSRNLKGFPKNCTKYNLKDTITAGRIINIEKEGRKNVKLLSFHGQLIPLPLADSLTCQAGHVEKKRATRVTYVKIDFCLEKKCNNVISKEKVTALNVKQYPFLFIIGGQKQSRSLSYLIFMAVQVLLSRRIVNQF